MFDERGLDYAINLLEVAFVQGRKDRALVREVLVDRTDTKPHLRFRSLVPQHSRQRYWRLPRNPQDCKIVELQLFDRRCE